MGTAREPGEADPGAAAASREGGRAGGAAVECALRNDERGLRQAMELLFFAYRDFTGDADRLLARYGFGRAHHRAIYFVGRHPGITVGDLLAILKITKQSLARVLGELMRGGFIVQRLDSRDRRRRRLYLSDEAVAMERMLSEAQAERLHAALKAAGPQAANGFRAVLRAMIDAEDRKRFDQI
ncbi:MAG TPA: MarR family transcriptional regulator [Rhodospirillales bacterium]|nr:MarR family transcriptional regulator [Rhodospirillales bacterium]